MVDERKNISKAEHQRVLNEVIEGTELFGKIYIIAAFAIGAIGGYLLCWMT